MANRNEIKLGTRVIKTSDAYGYFPQLVGIEGTVGHSKFGEGPEVDGCAVSFDNGESEWLFYENIQVIGGNE